MPEFRESQRLGRSWFLALLLIPLAVTSFGFYQQVCLGRPWGNHPVSNGAFIAIEVAAVAFILWFSRLRLDTEVRGDVLVIRFAYLWPTRAIALPDIRQARAVDYHPISSFGGWGVRWRPDGTVAYTATGGRGVDIQLRNGKRVIVGSQRADELEAVLRSHVAAA